MIQDPNLELAGLRQRNMQLEMILAQRSAMLLGEMTDALAFTARAARQDPNARRSLAEFMKAFEDARAAGSGLVLPHPGQEPPPAL